MEAVKHIPIEDREAFKYASAPRGKNNATGATRDGLEVYCSPRGRSTTGRGRDEFEEMWATRKRERRAMAAALRASRSH